MTRNLTRLPGLGLLTLDLLLAFNQTAQGCTHSLCHPLKIENARSLPSNGDEFRDVKVEMS
jgi:hypothetical protein